MHNEFLVFIIDQSCFLHSIRMNVLIGIQKIVLVRAGLVKVEVQ